MATYLTEVYITTHYGRESRENDETYYKKLEMKSKLLLLLLFPCLLSCNSMKIDFMGYNHLVNFSIDDFQTKINETYGTSEKLNCKIVAFPWVVDSTSGIGLYRFEAGCKFRFPSKKGIPVSDFYGLNLGDKVILKTRNHEIDSTGFAEFKERCESLFKPSEVEHIEGAFWGRECIGCKFR